MLCKSPTIKWYTIYIVNKVYTESTKTDINATLLKLNICIDNYVLLSLNLQNLHKIQPLLHPQEKTVRNDFEFSDI